MKGFTSKHVAASKIWRVAISNGHEEQDVRFIVARDSAAAVDQYRDMIEPNPLLPIDARFVPIEEYNKMVKNGE